MIIPEFLRANDAVGVVATAKKVDKTNTLIGIEILREWSLDVHIGKHVFEQYFEFAGTDAQRADDLQKMIDDPDIKAIFMVRGGYGSTRIIDRLDFEPLKRHPKWICGFSDITAFQLHLYRLGIASIHAPMPSFFYALNEGPLRRVHNLLFGKKETLKVEPILLNKYGKAQGKIIGGNLSIICHTIGTASEIVTKGNILFLEDVGENLYHIDRMMVQLKRGGFLNDLAGLVVGQFSDMKDTKDSFGFSAEELIHEHVNMLDFPVAFNFPIGHTNDNYAVPVGLDAELVVDESGSMLVLC